VQRFWAAIYPAFVLFPVSQSNVIGRGQCRLNGECFELLQVWVQSLNGSEWVELWAYTQ